MNCKPRIFYTIILSLFLFVTQLKAENDPVIHLSHGNNRILLSIFNNWENIINGMTLTIDETKIPAWLTIKVLETELNVGTTFYFELPQWDE